MKYRERINKILDKQDDEELCSIWFFLNGRTGYAGLEEEK